MGITLERNEMGETGILTQKQGTKTINGVKVPYYTGFGDSKKDHLGVNYKFDDKLSFNYMFDKKNILSITLVLIIANYSILIMMIVSILRNCILMTKMVLMLQRTIMSVLSVIQIIIL